MEHHFSFLLRIPLIRGVIIKSQVPLKTYVVKTLASVLFWFSCYGLNVLASTVAAQRFIKGRDVLPDLGMMVIPRIDFAWADAWFLFWVCTSVLRLIIFSEQGLVIFIRNFTIYGMVLFLRAFFLNLSLLPDPNPRCMQYTPVWQTYSPFQLTCGDMMFSGHTAFWVILTCCYLKYETTWSMRLVGILGTCIGAVILIASRAHYTIDVIVGAFVSGSVWTFYYLLSQNLRLPDYKLFPLMQLFEEGLPRDEVTDKQKTTTTTTTTLEV